MRVFTLAREDGTVTCAKGLRVRARGDVGERAAARRARLPGRPRHARELADERGARLDPRPRGERHASWPASAPARSCSRRPGCSTAGRRRRTGSRSSCCRRSASEIEVRPDDRFVDNGERDHRRRGLGRDRHGAAPGRAPALDRARPRGAALHPVRPRAAGLNDGRTAPGDITAAVRRELRGRRRRAPALRSRRASTRHLHAFAIEVGLTQARVGGGHPDPHRDRPHHRRPPAGVHPLVGHARALDARRRAREPAPGRGDRVDGARALLRARLAAARATASVDRRGGRRRRRPGSTAACSTSTASPIAGRRARRVAERRRPPLRGAGPRGARGPPPRAVPTRDDGSYAFLAVRPVPYTIPDDGPGRARCSPRPAATRGGRRTST